MRLLLVEDHVPLADEILAGLTRQGYAVDWLADGRDALYQGRSEPYDLIILDLGLPGVPGLEVLSQWRAAGLATPVLVLTARGSWSERIEGLKAGADDYLTKPFHPEELHLRIQALLRRSHGQANQPAGSDDDGQLQEHAFDEDTDRVGVGGDAVDDGQSLVRRDVRGPLHGLPTAGAHRQRRAERRRPRAHAAARHAGPAVRAGRRRCRCWGCRTSRSWAK